MSVVSEPATEELNSKSSSTQYASADEIFIHLSVPQVQKLNNEYKQNVTQAKQDLHNLVGKKYRDLIRIAEDINSMHLETGEVDSRLSDLSYGRSKFVNFHDANPYSKFESTLRRKKAEIARSESKLTILKYLINMTLLSFDMRLISAKSTPPFKHTSRYIHLAKVYYTIEEVFQDTFEAHPAAREKFDQFKTNFSMFLENELASYSANNNSIYSNDADIYKPANTLQYSDLLLTAKGSTFLEDGNVDIYGEEETDDLNLMEDDDSDDREWEFLESYKTNSSPLVNFLISYILLHHHDPQLSTLNEVLDKFLGLRQSYLERLTSELLQRPTSQIINIKLLKLFNFIENTCQYVVQYFEDPNTSTNELLTHLMHYTTAWKTQDIIGFHNWFNKSKIHIDQAAFTIAQSPVAKSINMDSLSKFAMIVFQFTDSVILKLGESGDAYQQVSKVLALLHNVIITLKKVDVYSSFNHHESVFMKIILEAQLLSKLLNNIIKSVTEVHDIHSKSINELEEQGSVLFAITSTLNAENASNFSSSTPSLFSPELVSMMDSEIDGYIQMMTEASMSRSLTAATSSPAEIVYTKVNEWFDIYFELNALLNTSAAPKPNATKGDQILPHLVNFLQRKFEYSDDDKTSDWGDFSLKLLEERFGTLHSQLTEALWYNVNVLLKHLSAQVTHFTEADNVHNVYFLLGVLITLKDRTVSGSKANTSITESIDVMVKHIYRYILDNISRQNLDGSLSFVQSLTQINQNVISKEFLAADEEFIVPSLKLTSLVYRFSTKLLSPDTACSKTNYTKAQIFLSSSVKDLFLETKNQWIRDQLIEGILWKGISHSGVEDETQQNEEAASSNKPLHQALQTVLVNILYLSCFTTNGPLSEADPGIENYLLKINSISNKQVSQTEVKLILKKVNEYYRSNKGVYLPILSS